MSLKVHLGSEHTEIRTATFSWAQGNTRIEKIFIRHSKDNQTGLKTKQMEM